MTDAKTKEPVIRTVAMPPDTNPAGDILGGWLMAQRLELLTAVGDSCCRSDDVPEARPGGDEVTLQASLKSTGRTSMKIDVEAWRRDRYTENREKVTDATFTFVASDHDGRPRALKSEWA